MKNVNEIINKKGLIKNTVKINIHYQGHKKKIEINMIGG